MIPYPSREINSTSPRQRPYEFQFRSRHVSPKLFLFPDDLSARKAAEVMGGVDRVTDMSRKGSFGKVVVWRAAA